MFCMDNYQVDRNLCMPCNNKGNNKGNTHLLGTNQMALQMEMFKYVKNKDLYIHLSYTYQRPRLFISQADARVQKKWRTC